MLEKFLFLELSTVVYFLYLTSWIHILVIIDLAVFVLTVYFYRRVSAFSKPLKSYFR